MKYLGHYLTVVVRIMLRHKVASALSIGGLSVGIAAAILILLFVHDELSFDHWIPDHQRIYKLEVTYTPPGRAEMDFANLPGPALPSFKAYFADQVEFAARIFSRLGIVREDDKLFEERIYYVDEEFFDVFDLEVVQGSREKAVRDNASILIGESVATKYFGRGPAVGKRLTLDGNIDYEVVGVFKDTPVNSHFKPEFIARFDENRYRDRPDMLESWKHIFFHSYFKLRANANVSTIENKLGDFIKARIPAKEDWVPEQRIRFRILPLTDIYLHSKSRFQLTDQSGNMLALVALIVVAVVIIVISSINFANLSISKSMLRAKEISMRKVLGANRSKLLFQFTFEAFFIASLSVGVAVVLVNLALPAYNNFLGRELSFNIIENPQLLLFCLAEVLVIGALAGLYPAFYMSKFRPGEVLKANKSSSSGSLFARNLIVGMQFAISVGLMVSTAIIYAQAQYAQNIELGFVTENRIQIRGAGRPSVAPAISSFVQEVKKIEGIEGVALASNSMPMVNIDNLSVNIAARLDTKPLIAESMAVNESFFDVYDVEVLAGRVFSERMLGDKLNLSGPADVAATAGVVVNNKFLQEAEFASPQSAIGKTVNFKFGERLVMATIVGVVGDMHLRSIHSSISPILFYFGEGERFNYITIKLSEKRIVQQLAAVDRVWRNLVADVPISRKFVDSSFDALYQDEIKRSKLFAIYSVTAIFIACLGLYAVASFSIERRTKEIGIRKVLGARTRDIAVLMLTQFSIPVLMGAILVIPFTIWFLNDWLQGFSYHISLLAHSYVFVLCIFISLLIAWLTIVGHTVKAARARPVESLKQE